jgi:hypothetical protein
MIKMLTSSPTNRLLSISEMLLRVGVILVPVACLAGVFLMTVGSDEAWILFGVRGLVEHGRYSAESPFTSVQSTGGMYTILASLLHIVGGGRIEVIRLLSVASVAALLFTLRLWALRFDIKSPHRWLVTAAPLLVPGTMMFGAQAYGEILAFLLVTVGLMLWGELEPGSWRRRLLIGILLGTAAATRPNVMFSLLAPLVVVLLTRSNRKHLIDSALVFVIGGFVFLLQFYILLALSDNFHWSPVAYAASSPFASQFGYFIPLRLSYWSIEQSFMPFVMAVLISIGWFQTRQGVKKPYGVDALLAFAWLAMLAWLFEAPIPHLRYLWPALAAFSVVGMFALALLLQTQARHVGNVLMVGFALLVTGYFDGIRIFKNGESDILSFELNRESSYSNDYRPFSQVQYQRAIVSRLLKIPPDEPIATYTDYDVALSFLTRRTVVPVDSYYSGEINKRYVVWRPAAENSSIRPRWIVGTPMLNHKLNKFSSNQLNNWIKENCRVAERQGPYVLYEVIGSFPEKPDIFSLVNSGALLP